jgi:hypothetical protein
MWSSVLSVNDILLLHTGQKSADLKSRPIADEDRVLSSVSTILFNLTWSAFCFIKEAFLHGLHGLASLPLTTGKCDNGLTMLQALQNFLPLRLRYLFV